MGKVSNQLYDGFLPMSSMHSNIANVVRCMHASTHVYQVQASQMRQTAGGSEEVQRL